MEQPDLEVRVCGKKRPGVLDSRCTQLNGGHPMSAGCEGCRRGAAASSQIEDTLATWAAPSLDEGAALLVRETGFGGPHQVAAVSKKSSIHSTSIACPKVRVRSVDHGTSRSRE